MSDRQGALGWEAMRHFMVGCRASSIHDCPRSDETRKARARTHRCMNQHQLFTRTNAGRNNRKETSRCNACALWGTPPCLSPLLQRLLQSWATHSVPLGTRKVVDATQRQIMVRMCARRFVWQVSPMYVHTSAERGRSATLSVSRAAARPISSF